jgi:hypothetical protein
MKLVVKNFGPIQEAVIDLSKKHFFFVGYNNTGKTYMSKLIYDIFSNEIQQDFAKSVYNNFKHRENDCLVLTKEIVDSILNDFATFLKNKAIPKSLKTNGRANFIVNNLVITFDYGSIDEIKEVELSSKANINFSFKENSEKNSIEIITLEKKAGSLSIEISENKDIYTNLPADFFDNVPQEVFENQIQNIKKSVTKDTVLTISILNLLLQNKETPFFLPANRIFILENADELIEQENQKQREFLTQLVELSENKDENKDKISDLLMRRPESNQTTHISTLINASSKLRRNKDDAFIENGTDLYTKLLVRLSKIMGGNIVLTEKSLVSNRREQFEFEAAGVAHRIDLFLASSSVNQLSTLYLYLKYWAKAANNFLMLDEPEVNLSPINQVRVLDLLLDFADKSNNKILITTHSPLLGQMLNNYLTLGQLENRTEVSEQLGFQDKNVNPENTGIYYFNGETVSEITISSYGAIYQSFKLVEDEVYQIGDYLSDVMIQQVNKK